MSEARDLLIQPLFTFEGDNITCLVPFDAPDGRKVIAFGSAEGVWVLYKDDVESTKHILKSKNVTQVAVHEDHGLFYVLADKSLHAYNIRALLPSASSEPVPYDVSRTRHANFVNYFSVGVQEGKPLVAYGKARESGSTLHILEPLPDRGSSSWFRIYMEYYIPIETHGFDFLKTKSAVVQGTEQYQSVNLENLDTKPIPSKEDLERAVNESLREDSRPIGAFGAGDEFLLCYTRYGLYVDQKSDITRPNPLVEWGSGVDSAALFGSYILLFGSQSIQIRDLQTGELLQDIKGEDIRGSDIRCLWNGRVARAGIGGDDHAIGVMKVDGNRHIFELVPLQAEAEV
ncbi:Rho guanine nucleotide exchange factor [Marasmius crinis-equi]|uniref:Rho guanine nucleotide exchange factor n=1 Tax=Marasmius crinis-equi TaxID=585013 RepID=A0ABR3G0F6_9AGAR